MFEANKRDLYSASSNKAYEKQVYTVKEIQRILGISKSTVYRLVSSNTFHCVKVGGHYRIPKKSFEEWMNNKGGSKNGIC